MWMAFWIIAESRHVCSEALSVSLRRYAVVKIRRLGTFCSDAFSFSLVVWWPRTIGGLRLVMALWGLEFLVGKTDRKCQDMLGF